MAGLQKKRSKAATRTQSQKPRLRSIFLFLVAAFTASQLLFKVEMSVSDYGNQFLWRNADAAYDEYELQLFMHNRRTALINESTVMELGANIRVDDMNFSRFLKNAFGDTLEWAGNESSWYDIFTDPNRGDLVVGKVGWSLCPAYKAFNRSNGGKPHVVFAHINENWGVFSSPVPNRTVDWYDLMLLWENQGCDRDDLHTYLNHPNLLAVFTTTHQSTIEPHPKVFPLPLGVTLAKQASEQLHAKPMSNRTKTVMINMSSFGGRPSIAKSVIANFGGTLNNTYKDGSDFWQQLREAKFILCPSGLGWDTYRSWEALVMGAIPVLETYYRRDGFYQAYDGLPVLWVDHYDNVTPSLLEKAYPIILAKAHEYKFEKLTIQWWIDLINSKRVAAPRYHTVLARRLLLF